ncbi:MAG: hypothetical protein MR727_10055 [Lentisphaeria bacterium]|nr:hypothetical protein [Lentisphaeria bacterium]
MKKSLAALLFCCVLPPVFAAEIVNYDFTGRELKSSGKLELPFYSGDVKIGGTDQKRSLYFNGEKSCASIPDSGSFHLLKGGTVLIKLKVETKPKSEHHMFILKSGEWWLAKDKGGKLYFNFCYADGKAGSGVMIPCDFSKTLCIGISVFPDDKYIICTNGKKLASGILTIPSAPLYNEKGIILGSGWGHLWNFKGDIFKLKLLDEPLSETQLTAATGE